jgi:hypothetical protein
MSIHVKIDAQRDVDASPLCQTLSSSRMSILDVGKACAQCSTIDYLPFTCPHCGLTFCQAHVQTHGCSTASITREQGQQAGPSTFKRKSTCEARGCERPNIEAIGGKDGETEEVIAREIRCSGCNGAFCTSYALCLSLTSQWTDK